MRICIPEHCIDEHEPVCIGFYITYALAIDSFQGKWDVVVRDHAILSLQEHSESRSSDPSGRCYEQRYQQASRSSCGAILLLSE